jgi:exodeoxyribonuclease-3
VYTPNAKRELTRLEYRQLWDSLFLDYMKRLEQSKPVIVCWDLNVAHKEIDLTNPKSNRWLAGFTDEERAGFQKFVDAGFVDTFRHFYPDKTEEYSWWSNFNNARARNIGWRIDYYLVSQILKSSLKKAFISQEILGSDHCPVWIDIEL